jgi:tetratricopeptide (TPR) repeat protein
MAENMNTIAPNDYPDVRSSRFPVGVIVHGLLALAILTTQPAQAAVECAPFNWEFERLDFRAEKDQRRIRAVQNHHFNADVENLIRGMTTNSAGGDIDFLVRHSPNHHRGLAALVRLALKDKTPRPVGVKIPVECYLLRALEFAPTDAEVHKIYGTYLSRLGRNAEALARYEAAEKLSPDDPVIAYNMGLLLAEKRDFEQARLYAKKAYAGGVELPGLRDKLARQGQWH